MALELTPEELKRWEDHKSGFNNRSGQMKATKFTPQWKLDAVRKMIADGVTHRQIALKVQVSKGRVAQIRRQMVKEGVL